MRSKDESEAVQRTDSLVIPDSEVQPGGFVTHLPLLQVADQQANHFSQVKEITLHNGTMRFEVHCNLPGLDDLVGRFEHAAQVEAWKEELLQQSMWGSS